MSFFVRRLKVVHTSVEVQRVCIMSCLPAHNTAHSWPPPISCLLLLLLLICKQCDLLFIIVSIFNWKILFWQFHHLHHCAICLLACQCFSDTSLNFICQSTLPSETMLFYTAFLLHLSVFQQSSKYSPPLPLKELNTKSLLIRAFSSVWGCLQWEQVYRLLAGQYRFSLFCCSCRPKHQPEALGDSPLFVSS